MSEGHGDPPADVRSFLPRPGEPVEEYAERLRALHRDLTLVLEAVDRGLAAAADPRDVPPPAPVDVAPRAPVDVAPAGEPRPVDPHPPRFRRAGARVEVLPAAAGEGGRDDPADLRRRREDDVPLRPAPGDDELAGEAPRPPHFPSRPSDAPVQRSEEPRWVEHPAEGERLTAPTFPAAPGAPAVRLDVPPWVVGAFAAAWLVVVVLLVALLVS